MRADETNMLKFMNGQKQFVIPIYQRTYSWTNKECSQLWNDILRAGKDRSISGHFIGSIVYVEKGLYQVSAIPQLLVIDGQQRLTTISLLLIALSEALDKKGPINGMNKDKIKNYYLMNRDEEGNLRYKLVLTQSDKETLFKLIDATPLPEVYSKNLKNNYEFFKTEIEKNDLETVLEGIQKLIIIDVSLDRERDNPQLIFESLNSTGLELTQADLIRNYILMGLKKEEQERLYNDYWYPMEKSFGHAEYSALFDRFMRDYLTIKTGKIPKIREVYRAFKQHAKNYSMEELISEIYKFSGYFVSMALGKEPDNELKDAFHDINTLKVDVSYPLLLKVYEDYVNGTIQKSEFLQILRYIESYVFRRAICGIPTNSLNKTFANLYKEISIENYLESFKAALLLKSSYRRFPKNEEFKEQLVIKDIYNFRNRNYLLRKLENYDRKEMVNIESYTIEHIMPQNENLSPAWKRELGDDWKDVHEKYLHTLGNLTLTGYNSELSDRPFKKKRDMKGGFADSPIRLNRSLAKLETWNESEIKKRAAELADLAQRIWIAPELDEDILKRYSQKEEKNNITYTIDTIKGHQYIEEGGPMQPVFDDLRKRILNIDSSVKEQFLKSYVAYKTTTNFVDIVPQKNSLKLSINLHFDEINDPKNLCKDVTNKGSLGNGDVEIKVSKIEEIDYAIYLIKQAYEKISEVEE